MFAVLSPAKKLDFCSLDAELPHTQPRFQNDTEQLLKKTRTLSSRKLQDLMGISEALGTLNQERFQQIELPVSPDKGKQAALAFAGDTYTGLDAPSLSSDDLAFAQNHLGILSGFYGLLRPMDLIQPYRLEMGTRLQTRRGKDLYAFWGDRIRKQIEAEVSKHQTPVLVNLASKEYFKATCPKDLGLRTVTPNFYEMRPNGPKMISFLAKKARGMMARYMITNRIEDPEGLKAFDLDGYVYDPDGSEPDHWRFVRG
ncbi:MAG TPA: peroxide stress protein YaaA [Myxococcales bacterium]|nr:hypothetical protein [Myxococcales bacterium]HBU47091.1 peroxide stress protein YaaA [Myxococcales bacterium]|tara:strand:+ start:254 stop:1021 length:768 start_codon:yes stop_codon:yes gene_type:complete